MCEILLSINPEHVENIFNGSKEYEFRKVKCTKPVDKIIIYSTAPTKQVVGEAEVDAIVEGTPTAVWNQTKSKAGIDEQFYFNYYEGKKVAFAYKLVNIVKYSSPKSLSNYGLSAAPQSFAYV